MQLIFLYGQAAAGKLTVARALAERTGLPLFHNHLIVDSLLAVFPFGSEEFVRLRDQFWMETFAAAAHSGRSLLFTFAPEGTVAADFPQRAAATYAAAGGRARFFALTVGREEQERRLTNPSRAAFGKLQSVELLRSLRAELDAAFAAMPAAELTLDTGALSPDESAARIAAAMQGA